MSAHYSSRTSAAGACNTAMIPFALIAWGRPQADDLNVPEGGSLLTISRPLLGKPHKATLGSVISLLSNQACKLA